MSESTSRVIADSTHQERILRVADACFEMFSIQELKRPITILHEIAHSFPEATATEITEAIKLAISWRRALRYASGWTH
jgi:hypothetical protein